MLLIKSIFHIKMVSHCRSVGIDVIVIILKFYQGSFLFLGNGSPSMATSIFSIPYSKFIIICIEQNRMQRQSFIHKIYHVPGKKWTRHMIPRDFLLCTWACMFFMHTISIFLTIWDLTSWTDLFPSKLWQKSGCNRTLQIVSF